MTTQAEGKTMSLADVSAKTGMDQGYLQRLVKHGYINPNLHWGSVERPTSLPKGPSPTDALRAEKDGYKGSEAERIDLVRDARRDKMPWAQYLQTEVISSEERFKEFWDLPRGKQRLLDPRTRREVDNLERGYPVWTEDRPIVVVSPGVPGEEGGYIGGSLKAQMETLGKIAPDGEDQPVYLTQGQVDQIIADQVTQKLAEMGVTAISEVPATPPKPKKPKAKRKTKQKSPTREE